MTTAPEANGALDLNAGALAPVAAEVDIDVLDVTGELPADLNGTLLRNGPNPLDGRFVGGDMLSWWTASAMMHGLTLADGRAVRYRNRWARSAQWARHHDVPHDDPAWEQNPNVNVINHGGRTLALGEGGLPFILDESLTPVAPFDYGGILPGGMTAHPKIDPATGELRYIRASWQAGDLHYGVLDGAGRSIASQTIDAGPPAMMHDMAITESSTLLLDLGVAFDFSILSTGAPLPLRWDDDRSSRIGVIARPGGPVRWFDIGACFIQHVINAYDLDAQTIVLDAVRYPWFLRFDSDTSTFDANPLGVAWRYVIHLDSGTVSEHQLDDRHIELPRIDERSTGRPHRYAYAVEQPTDIEMRGIVRYDLDADTTQTHAIPPGDQNSEPVFVGRPRSVDGGDGGWLLVCVFRAASDTTDVIVLDAQDITDDPVATVHLPVRIPAGFHGTWIPTAEG